MRLSNLGSFQNKEGKIFRGRESKSGFLICCLCAEVFQRRNLTNQMRRNGLSRNQFCVWVIDNNLNNNQPDNLKWVKLRKQIKMKFNEMKKDRVRQKLLKKQAIEQDKKVKKAQSNTNTKSVQAENQEKTVAGNPLLETLFNQIKPKK